MLKRKSVANREELQVCLHSALAAIRLNPKAAPLLRFYAVAIALFTLFESTGSPCGSHLPELHPPFTRTNRSPQSPILIVEMVYSDNYGHVISLVVIHIIAVP